MSNSNFQREIFNKYETKSNKEIVDLEIDKMIRTMLNKGDLRNIKILEVGCGGGQLLSSFTKYCDIYGLDISEKSLEVAKSNGYHAVMTNIETDQFPFSDDFFTIIVMNDVLEHITYEDHCLREIRRILKKDGKYILCVPNISHPIAWAMQIFLDLPPRMSARYKSPHVRDYTVRLTKIVLKINGFDIDRINGTFIYPFQNRISRFFANLFPRFSERFIIVSKKGGKCSGLRDIRFDIRELLKYE